MKILHRCLVLTLIAVLAPILAIEACTSVIVSGRATKDGRPFIFKNRDTHNQDNLAVLVKGERYRYIAIVDARDSLPRHVWSGHNEAGFAIMNTAAYNLNGKERPGEANANDGKGNAISIMKRALEVCATLRDFETLLDTLPRPLRSNSNFGVMDAEGGVAYYETGNERYVKFDANDPNVAPYGYLIRTNHGFSGDRELDQGVERYLAISDYMLQAGYTGQIDAARIIGQVPRHLTHGLTKINLRDMEPQGYDDNRLFPFRDFIPRYLTASSTLIQGVKLGESPLLTIAWTIIGHPFATVDIPLLITPTEHLPQLVTRGPQGYSELCHWGLSLKAELFPLKRGNKEDYIDVARLFNREGTGILQRTLPIEQAVLKEFAPVLERIREKGKPDSSVDDYYKWADKFVREQYQKVFNVL